MSRRTRLFVRALEDRVTPTTFTVGNLADSGAGSLRQAVADANGASGADSISFSIQGVITLTSGELSVTDSLTITGPGSDKLTIKGNNASRIFNVSLPVATGTFALSGVALIGGSTAGNGGAIVASAKSLSVSQCILSGNKASGFGGAIYATTPISVSQSFLTSNSAAAGGGAFLTGGATLDVCAIADNVATAGNGGGVANNSNTASVTITNSQVSGNSTSGNGGGFWNLLAPNTIQNCTFSGNTAAGNGGGMFLQSNTSNSQTIQNCTIAFNTATGKGGGVNSAVSTPLSFTSTVVARNTAASNADIYFSDKLTYSKSFFSEIGGPGFYGVPFSGVVAPGVDPLLAPLAFNGGPTMTHALLPGSPLLDRGSNPAGLSFDQRGNGFPRQQGDGVDIGAFEGTTPLLTAIANTLPVYDSGATTQNIDVTYYADTGINVATLGNADVSVSGPGGYLAFAKFVSVDIAGNGTPRTATYQITPPGGSWDASDNGTYTISQVASQVVDVTGAQIAPAIVLKSFKVAAPSMTYVVSHLPDENDGNTAAGNMSLREAIGLANASVGVVNAITFDPSVFAAPQSMTLTLGEIAITDGVTITGPAARLTINANQNSRIFNITAGDQNVAMNGLTLTNGKVTTGGGAAMVINAGSVFLNDCTLSGNTASALTSIGGAVYVPNNSALTIARCSITGNSAGTSTAARGGGIGFVRSGALQITDSTIANNSASGLGGGIALSLAAANLRNVTISNNFAGQQFGGMNGGSVPFLMRNSTVAFNTAGMLCGGMQLDNLIMSNTIVAKNQAPQFPDCTGVATGDYNLIGNDFGGTVNGGTHNLINVDPLLSALANNGGPTMTHALMSGSPALNAGTSFPAIPFDQRGNGFFRNSGGAVDIGAYEVQSPPRVQSVVINGGAVQRSRVTSITVTFDSLVNLPVTPATAFQLQRQNDSQKAALTASVTNDAVTTVTLTFAGGLSESGSLQDGRYTLTVLAGSVSNINGQLDGNGNGAGGDDYALIGDPATNKLFRLYGDVDGNGLVDGVDFGAFRNAFNTNSTAFDFDGNGIVDGADFGQFRARFGIMI